MLVLLDGTCAGTALAHEHWTAGPVWSCSACRTAPGQADDCVKDLRENFVPASAPVDVAPAPAGTCDARSRGTADRRPAFQPRRRYTSRWSFVRGRQVAASSPQTARPRPSSGTSTTPSSR